MVVSVSSTSWLRSAAKPKERRVFGYPWQLRKDCEALTEEDEETSPSVGGYEERKKRGECMESRREKEREWLTSFDLSIYKNELEMREGGLIK